MAPRSAHVWDTLTPTYRRRLERAGITREGYLSGTSLQRARGQASEAPGAKGERAQSVRRALLRERGIIQPSASTVRSWKRRAAKRGVKGGDFDEAVRAVGFEMVKAKVQSQEAKHKAWQAAKSPNKAQRARESNYGSTMAALEAQSQSRMREISNGPLGGRVAIPSGGGGGGGYGGGDDEDEEDFYDEEMISDHDYDGLLYEDYYDYEDYEWPESFGHYH